MMFTFLRLWGCRGFSCVLLFWALLAGAAEEPGSETNTNLPVVLVLGDSLAAGYGLDLSESFPALVQQLSQEQGIPIKVVNAGLSGDTTAGGLRRLGWLLRGKIDVLILELGANDGLRGLSTEATRTNLQTIINKTREKFPQASIVLAGMEVPPNMGEVYAAQFRQVFQEVAATSQATLVPFLLENVGGKADLNQADQLHPTAAGQKIVAQNVWKVLKPLLEKRRTQAATPSAGREKTAAADGFHK